MIPDGTSIDVVTLARWYNDNKPLNIDPYICGAVRTYSIDNKIPDSAPTSTAYATGVKTRAPFIGVDSSATPRISVLELAKLQKLLTGVVVTCEFPHATPADFVCHLDNRESRKYDNLSRQFMYNSPAVVFAGGLTYLKNNSGPDLLGTTGITLLTTVNEFNALNILPDSGKCLWALFPDWRDSTKCLSFEKDRDSTRAPALSQMTKKALQLLSGKKRGFFLMVEGSQIDWAAHFSDPLAAVTDFLEFDKAVGVAIEFAKRDRHTAVIICPDHSTGGMSIGNFRSNTDILGKNPDKYENININERIIDSLKQIKWTGRKLAEMMLADRSYISADSLQKYYHFKPQDELVTSLDSVSRMAPQASLTDTLQQMIGRGFSDRNFIGWTTSGHTAEDMFLAVFTPKRAEKKTGVVENYEIGRYIASLLKLGNIDTLTKEYYCRHTELFSDKEAIVSPDSIIISRNNLRGVVQKNTNRLLLNGTEIRLPTIAVFLNNAFYLPKEIVRYFNQHVELQ
jgi:alkaline phosphatase